MAVSVVAMAVHVARIREVVCGATSTSGPKVAAAVLHRKQSTIDVGIAAVQVEPGTLGGLAWYPARARHAEDGTSVFLRIRCVWLVDMGGCSDVSEPSDVK